MTTASLGDEDRELVDDLFHALSQPLTSLRCSMEVALLEQRTSREYQESLEQGLDLAERISGLVGDLRELWDTQGSNRSGRTTSLQDGLDEIVGDLMPLAEAEGKAILLSPEARELKIEGLPRRGVFLLLQHALGICAPGVEVKVESSQPTLAVRISVSQSVSGRVAEDKAGILRRRLNMAIARRSFESAGFLLKEEAAAGEWRCEVLLPEEWEGCAQ